MISTSKQQTTTYTTSESTLGKQLIGTLLWPFTNRYSSPIWLALRLYLAWIWVQMGVSKLEAGWLTSDPIGQMLKMVANGTIPVPLSFYRGVADALVSSGITPMLSHSMPFLELAVALSFITGVLVPVAAVGAILLNVNFMLSGIGTIELDGPVIAGQLLLIASYRVVGVIGFERLAARIVNGALSVVRPARKARPAGPSAAAAEQ
jgi:uncharacterized membrane protein YphA (DoxX/SURF4 family)